MVLNCVSVIVVEITTSEGVVTLVLSVDTLADCEIVNVVVIVA